MLWFASPPFQLILACLPSVLLASGLTPPLNEAGNTQQGSPQNGEQPAAVQDPAQDPDQDPASLSQSADDPKMLSPPKEVLTDGDGENPDWSLQDFAYYVEDNSGKPKKAKSGKNGKRVPKVPVKKAKKSKINENQRKESISETIHETIPETIPATIPETIQAETDNDDSASIVDGNQVKNEAPLPGESQGGNVGNVIDQKKVWPWKEFGIGVVSGGAGLLTGGLSGYYIGKSGSGNGSSGQVQVPGNETEQGEEASPNWQQIVYLLSGVTVILLILWLASIACWCCKAEDEEHSKEAQGKGEGRQSRTGRKSGKSKSKQSKRQNSELPSTIETLGSADQLATSDYGSMKKSVKSQMNMTPTSTPTSTPRSTLPSGVKSKSRKAASKLPSAMVSSVASSCASKPSVLSVFSSAVVSTASKIASKVTPKSGK